MVGRTVSHYQILEKLGTGGMGEIYRALDPRLNRFVAIKVLSGGMSSDPSRRRRFIQEAQAASGLNHPNIITIYDVVTEHDADLMVMEFVAGRTLLDLIPKGGLRVPQVLNYAVQMADALAVAHAAGIVHRDLKPGNVMVTDAGRVKILDFGLAKLDRTSGPISDDAETVAQDALTVEGSIMGTVSYMSPEQAQGQRVDARSDIFSFGILLYEMATGARPFAGESAIATLSSILRDEARPMGELSPDAPPELQELIARCLRKSPDERWQSMKEVHDALAALKQDSDSGLLYQKQAAPPPAPRKRPVAALVVILLVVLAAAAGFWFLRSRPPAGPAAAVIPPAPSAPAVAVPKERAEKVERPEKTEAPEPGAKTPAVAPVPAVAPPPAPAPPPPAAAVSLRDGFVIGIALGQDIPADAAAGTPVAFNVSKEVDAPEGVLIRKGAAVKGEIVQESKKKFLGIGGKMQFQLLTLEAADGQSIKVRATPARRENVPSWRPVELGGRKPPKGVAAVAGTTYVAYVDGDQSVAPRK